MKKITLDMIKAGLENNTICIAMDEYECDGICCKIGNNAFYFLGLMDVFESIDDYWKNYTKEQTAQLIYDAICTQDVAELTGIYEEEWDYYYNMLK